MPPQSQPSPKARRGSDPLPSSPGASGDPSPPGRGGRAVIVVIVLLLVGAFAGWGAWRLGWLPPGLLAALPPGLLAVLSPPPAAGGAPGGPGGAPPVTVATPVRQPVTEWAEFTGQFDAVEQVEIRARVGGHLTEIGFTDGQMVKAGDLLFVVDPRPYEIAVASARAKLDQAVSGLEFARRQLGRAGELSKGGALSQSTLDQRVEEQRGAAAGVEAARAAVRDAELALLFARVTAPVSGRIGAHQVSIGNLITGAGTGGGSGSGATLLTTIVTLDPIHFGFSMSEADYFTLRRRERDAKAGQRTRTADAKQPDDTTKPPNGANDTTKPPNGTKQDEAHADHPGPAAGGVVGMPVRLRLMDQTGWPYEGRINFIDNRIDPGSGTIRVRVVLDNPDHFIAPGAFGRARLALSAPADLWLVPDAAIVTDQSRKLVMTVDSDGTVVPRPVQPGPLVDGLRAVRSGLSGDERVVINGLMRARPGAKVTPQPGTIEAKP